jgi:hypothetical protein
MWKNKNVKLFQNSDEVNKEMRVVRQKTNQSMNPGTK